MRLRKLESSILISLESLLTEIMTEAGADRRCAIDPGYREAELKGSKASQATSDSKIAMSMPSLGLATLSALVIANMIGAGVFTSSGYSLGALGNPKQVMVAWAVCGVWALCGAVAYGSLIARLPHSGGEYLFLSRFVHPSIGFLAGWISVIAGFTAPIAAAALGAAVYCLPDYASDSAQVTQLACVLIVVATICHLVGIGVGTAAQNIIVAAKLALILLLIVWAFFFTPAEAWQGKLESASMPWLPDSSAAWVVLVGSMSWVALSYTGFNAAIYVAGESRDARRRVPQAMLAATILVTLIYLLLNYVFVFAPTAESISNQGDVATIAAASIGGNALEWLVRVTIVLSMTSSVFAMLLAGPRVYQKMAEDGVMPSMFKGAHGLPRTATLVQATLSIFALLLADLLQLMKYLGLTLSACGALAVLSLWWVRMKLPAAPNLRWWELICVTVYLGITFLILAASWTEHRQEFQAMLVTFALGPLVYLVWNWWDRWRLRQSKHQISDENYAESQASSSSGLRD